MAVIGNQVGLTLERIVLATDFSSSSQTATAYARLLARHFSSNLTLVHVVDLTAAAKSEEAVAGLVLDERRLIGVEKLEQVMNEMISEGVHATAQTLESHHPAAAIVGLSNQLHADMIVMGSNARHGLGKIFIGSCSEGVIRHATCPVMTVGPKTNRPTGKSICFNTVIFATDFGPDAAEKAAVAAAIAQDGMARLYLCHVSEHPGKDIAQTVEQHIRFEESLQKLIPSSTYEYISPECVVEYGDSAEHILDLAKRVNADLIVLGATRSFSWFTNLADGVVGRILGEAECPILTICIA
jgi:nucleotide-binding universal stress UspA family protein